MGNNAKNLESLAWPTVQRLSEYLLILEQHLKNHKNVISSNEMAEIFGNTASQVRQDLFRLKNTGRVGQGYQVETLIATIRQTLGLGHVTKVALIGCGKLGSAIAEHVAFSDYGMELQGIFDNNSSVIGTHVGGVVVGNVVNLADGIREQNISIAALCVPPAVAQEITEVLVNAGIKGILNYTRQRLKVPEKIFVQDCQIICSFMQLAFISNSNKAG